MLGYNRPAMMQAGKRNSFETIGKWTCNLASYLQGLLFEHPLAPWALFAAALVLYLPFTWQYTFLHDEGIFTYDMTRLLWQQPVAAFFLLKVKPVLALLYLPTARLGFKAFLVVHAGLAATTVLLVCLTARDLGTRIPAAAGWMLMLSGGFFVAAVSGFANLEGAFFLALFLWLYFSGRRKSGALVLGLLPFVRHELAVVWLFFLGWDLWRRRRQGISFVLLAAAFPSLYIVLGAWYHGDLLWLIHNFPSSSDIPVAISFNSPTAAGLREYWQRSLLCNFGVLGVLALLAVGIRQRVVLILFVSALAIYAVMTLFQYQRIFGFNASLRYHVAVLPLVAILSAKGLENDHALTWMIAALLAFAVGMFSGAGSWMFIAVAIFLPILMYLGKRWRMNTASLARILVLVSGMGVLYLGMAYGEDFYRQHRQSHRLFHWLSEQGFYHGQPVYSDMQIFRYDECSGIKNRYQLANEAIYWELSRFTNHGNGQYRDLVDALRKIGYAVDPSKHRINRQAVYIVRRCQRFRRWIRLLEEHHPHRVVEGNHLIYYWDVKEAG